MTIVSSGTKTIARLGPAPICGLGKPQTAKTRLGGRVLNQPIGVGFLYFSFQENDMSHPKNTTAPPEAQLPRPQQPFEALGSFTYYEVQVVHEDAGFTRSFPGVQDECLAVELKAMPEPEVSPHAVRISWVAGQEDQVEDFLRMEDRMTDMIRSLRSAACPGHEFMARLGQFGPYEGYATQNADSKIVSRTSQEVRP